MIVHFVDLSFHNSTMFTSCIATNGAGTAFPSGAPEFTPGV